MAFGFNKRAAMILTGESLVTLPACKVSQTTEGASP